MHHRYQMPGTLMMHEVHQSWAIVGGRFSRNSFQLDVTVQYLGFFVPFIGKFLVPGKSLEFAQ
jgi:hypothetical protein